MFVAKIVPAGFKNKSRINGASISQLRCEETELDTFVTMFLNHHVRKPKNHHRRCHSHLRPLLFPKVNGCELPGGFILSVQPSDPHHKVTTKISLNGSANALHSKEHLPPRATAGVTKEHDSSGNKMAEEALPTTGKTENSMHINMAQNTSEEHNGNEPDEEEEDLDDFFASFE
mmetsp:Transcript_7643/g.16477  ORF Transcript_7643/g.16477 Transcript_7643/m.16477 type:complete len:174 (+) Transcript_7643:1522-2043(+)